MTAVQPFAIHVPDEVLTVMPWGGHFVAFEEPELLAQDIRAFFRPLRG